MRVAQHLTTSKKSSSSIHASRVKLQKLTLKKFVGKPTDWTAFWDSFESSIHGNDDISDVSKFIYLNSLLKGPAADALAGLQQTSVNYSEAIAILKKRFGNKQLIISKHMDLLINVKPVSTHHYLKALCHLYNVVETQVRSLRSLGVSSGTYGSLLASFLVNKLPQKIRLIISREMTDENWDLDKLMEIFENQVETRESSRS